MSRKVNLGKIVPEKGVDYFDGANGADGFSPIANVTQIDDGAIISITDKVGTSTATVLNGKDGENGKDGADGITPHIGENGNWWIGDTDTGKPASGSGGGLVELPIATAETLGGIKVGEGLEINDEGVLKTLINKYKLLENSQVSVNTVTNDYSIMTTRSTFDTSGNIYSKSIVKLANGNLLLAYTDGGSSGYGKFVIYNQKTGTFGAAVTFSSTRTYYAPKAIALDNNNIMIVYRDNSNGDTGEFVIYNQDGTLVKSATIYTSNAIGTYNDVVKLNNGNVMIVYSDATDNSYGKFVIYDQDGNLVKEAITFEGTGACTPYNGTAVLRNGNVFIAYKYASESGKFVIYDQDGNLVKGATVFTSVGCQWTNSLVLDNGNVFLAYISNENNDGKFVIYDQNGQLVKEATTFKNNINELYTKKLPNSGNVFMCYGDVNNDYYGKFVIYDQEGNIAYPETTFETSQSAYFGLCVLDNGNIFLGYSATNLADDGYFKIIGTGDIVTYKKEFTLNDLGDLEEGQHVRVWNNTPNVGDVVYNSLNDVEINAVLNVGYYDLVYNGEILEATKVQDESGIIEVPPIPVASVETLGGIKVGEGLEITEDGVLSALGGSSSSGENYSTDEQKIGTWIDGKPLYQKTITGYNVPTTSTDGTVAGLDIPLTDISVDSFINVIALLKGSTYVMRTPAFWDRGYYGATAYYAPQRNAIYVKNTAKGYNGSELIVTIKYTKTTD